MKATVAKEPVRNWFRPSAFSDFLVLPCLRGYFAASAIHVKNCSPMCFTKLARSAQFLHWSPQFDAFAHRFPGYIFGPSQESQHKVLRFSISAPLWSNSHSCGIAARPVDKGRYATHVTHVTHLKCHGRLFSHHVNWWFASDRRNESQMRSNFGCTTKFVTIRLMHGFCMFLCCSGILSFEFWAWCAKKIKQKKHVVWKSNR